MIARVTNLHPQMTVQTVAPHPCLHLA